MVPQRLLHLMEYLHGACGNWLTERFHDQGAVPVVYLYVIFRTAVLVNWVGHSAGIVPGYWMGEWFGES